MSIQDAPMSSAKEEFIVILLKIIELVHYCLMRDTVEIGHISNGRKVIFDHLR